MLLIRYWLKIVFLGILLFTVSLGIGAESWDNWRMTTYASPLEGLSAECGPLISYLPPGNAVTDGRTLLRNALPIHDKEVRKLQADLEDISEWLRSKRWGPIKRDISKVGRVLNTSRSKMLEDVPPKNKAAAETLLDQFQVGLGTLREAVSAEDKEQTWSNRAALLKLVTEFEELMVEGFPFEIPQVYSHLPQLRGRATVEFETRQGTMTAIVDGFSAPITAGNFVDLVQRGFYDGLEFTRAEDYYILQTGDPPGPETGFVDPKTGEYRTIPLEILVKGDSEPIYGETLENLGRYLDDPVLPFSAFGTLGMAAPSNDVNGASSQFFFFLFEPELTPAGLNLLDGRYAVFGYVVEGKEILNQLTATDRILSAKVVSGLENLVQPTGV